MILFDPDLDPDPTLDTLPTKRASPLDSTKTDRQRRLPSARTLGRFLIEAQAAVRLRGQVTVLLTTDRAIRRLNRRFRGKNTATDVLSFPAGGPIKGEVAGDLAISAPTALRQAGEQGHALSVEIKVLILHGLLHLAGFDHEVDDGQMARRERLLRARLRLPQGLIERAAASTNSAPKRPAAKSAGAKNPTAKSRLKKRASAKSSSKKLTAAEQSGRGVRP